MKTKEYLIDKLETMKYDFDNFPHEPCSCHCDTIITDVIEFLQSQVSVAYLCDKKACSDCPGEPCHHTVDITHAVNFEYVGVGTKYMEKDLVINTKMSKLMEEIKPCPFCGSEAQYLEYQKMDGNTSYTIGIVCCHGDSCGCRTRDVIIDGYYGATTTKEDVIKLWNRRANHV